MSTVKLVATDLDGTLVRSDLTVSGRAKAALTTAQDAGIHVVLVTGRPPRWVVDLAADLGLRGEVICANGAIVYDASRRVIVEHRPLDPAATREIVAALREHVPGCMFALECGEVFSCEPAFAALLPRSLAPGTRVDDVLALATEPVTKLILRHPEVEFDVLLEASLRAVGERAVCTHSTSTIVEISAPGVSKASALAALCEGLGVSRDAVAAFGDMPNDLPMLAWAGRSIAVANAHPEVLAAVDQVTASNDEDGVAIVLEALTAGVG